MPRPHGTVCLAATAAGLRGFGGGGGGGGQRSQRLQQLLDGGARLAAALVVWVGAAQAERLRRLGERLVVVGEVAVRVRAPQLVVPLFAGGKRRKSERGWGESEPAQDQSQRTFPLLFSTDLIYVVWTYRYQGED